MNNVWTFLKIANKYYWKQKANLVILCMLLVAGLLMTGGERLLSEDRNVVGYQMPQEVAVYLDQAGDAIFTYEAYPYGRNQMITDIQKGKLCAGFVMEEGEHFLDGTDVKLLKTSFYCKNDMNLSGVLQEEVASALYQYYSAAYFDKLLTEAADEQTAEEGAKLVKDALADGNLFRIELCTMPDSEVHAAGNDLVSGTSAPATIRAVMALLLTLCACYIAVELAGMTQRRYLTGTEIRKFQAVYTGISLAYPTIISLIFILFHRREYGILLEVTSLMGYAMILGILAYVAGRNISGRLLMAGIPIYLIMMLLTSPVLFRLGAEIKVIEWLGYIFPITWYLGLF